MKKFILSLIFVFILAVTFMVTSLPPSSAFLDVDSTDPYYEAVENLKENKIIADNDYFNPYEYLNRAEAAALALRSSGIIYNYMPKNSPFSDLIDVEEDWIKRVAFAAKDHNIMQGTENGKFEPFRKVTKAEFVKIALEAFYVDIPEVDYNVASDSRPSHWWNKYFAFAIKQGFLPETYLEPDYIGGYDLYLHYDEPPLLDPHMFWQRRDVSEFLNKILQKRGYF